MNANQNYLILFWINKSKTRNGLAPIYCRITVNGKRAEVSMKRSVEPSNWINSIGVAKGKSESACALNSFLDVVCSNIHKNFMNLIFQGKFITADTIKNNFLGLQCVK